MCVLTIDKKHWDVFFPVVKKHDDRCVVICYSVTNCASFDGHPIQTKQTKKNTPFLFVIVQLSGFLQLINPKNWKNAGLN